MAYASLKDVAARAGVSFQTASKVLNGQAGVVADTTRTRILDAAATLGYVPNALARGLVRQSSLTIGILADDFSDPALSRFVVSAQREAGRLGQASLVASTVAGADPTAPLRGLLEHRVDGLLVVAPSLEDDERLAAALSPAVPAVSLAHVPGGGVPVVGSDHRRTGALAAEHLLALGHRVVAAVTGPLTRRVVRSRLRGFTEALAAAGVPLPESRTCETDWSSTGGRASALRLLAAEPGITAVFAQNDELAAGVLRALRELGRRVPDDCSVVGCDDLWLAPFLDPPLTTVQVPFEATGARATQLLLARIGGGQVADRELLPVHLVVRSSTGPAP